VSTLAPLTHIDDIARQAWTETLLERLVALNTRRAADEARGVIRWLRPEFQNPATQGSAATAQPEHAKGDEADEACDQATPGVSANVARRPWPAELPEQMRATAEVLAASATALGAEAIAGHFTGRGPWKKRLPQILDTLEALGRARKVASEPEGAWSRA
jgi:hypothetical protein